VNAGLASDIVIKLLPKERNYTLSFQRSFDGASYDIPLRHWEERLDDLRKELPLRLDPLRKHIGVVNPLLNEQEIKRASGHLDRVGYGILALLLQGSGRTASDTMADLIEFLAPVFLVKPAPARPLVEIEAAATDDLAWRMPFEFFPVAPALNPQLAPREDLERFLGFRAEIVRSLRPGSIEIERDRKGRVPVHLFAHTGEPLKGMRDQTEFLHTNTTVVSEWPVGHIVADAYEGVSQLAERLLSLSPPGPDGTIRSIAHFSCHYVAGGPDREGYTNKPTLFFGESGATDINIDIFELRGELEAKLPPRAPSPFAALFFLNTCESAAGGSYGNTLLGFLQDRKATAILGSETSLPDRLAGEFAIEFYRGLLRSVPVGKAVLEARRRLLERYGNPVGLFYTFFGNPLLQVKEAAP
jgi:hypothetical protein